MTFVKIYSKDVHETPAHKYDNLHDLICAYSTHFEPVTVDNETTEWVYTFNTRSLACQIATHAYLAAHQQNPETKILVTENKNSEPPQYDLYIDYANETERALVGFAVSLATQLDGIDIEVAQLLRDGKTQTECAKTTHKDRSAMNRRINRRALPTLWTLREPYHHNSTEDNITTQSTRPMNVTAGT